MEGNWNALIYILLSIVIFAVSAMWKKKKRDSQFDIDKGVHQKQDVFDVLTGGQIYEDRIKAQLDNEEIKPVEAEIKNIDQISRLVDENDAKKETNSLSNLYERQDASEEIEEEDFDLRQAVIYSEILNRKPF